MTKNVLFFLSNISLPIPPLFYIFLQRLKKYANGFTLIIKLSVLKNKTASLLKKGGDGLLLSISLIFGLFAFSAVQAENAGGCLKVTESCEAYQSFRKQTNPGDIKIKAGERYQILERSRKSKAFRIQIKGIKRPARWVAAKCGEVLTSCDSDASKSNESDKTTTTAASTAKKSFGQRLKSIFKRKKKTPQYLLALSWQPTFCEGHSRKKECRTQSKNRYDASHWSLHGLWPQPRGNAYCNVSDMDKGIDRNKRWHLLAPVKLSQKTAMELALVMPGASSNLQRHEWIKHGTCYGSDAEDYYSDAIKLTKAVNNSIVGKLFNRGVGKRVTLKQVRAHFDKAFGKGAGSKVDMRCDRRGRVSELWINLKGEIDDDTTLASLLKDSIRAGSTCFKGVIDPANR